MNGGVSARKGTIRFFGTQKMPGHEGPDNNEG